MNEPSIFTRIINGEIPCQKIYEDDKTIAFLDIHPSQPGHTLVVPKAQVDRVEDLTGEDYSALMSTLQKVMQRIVTVFGGDYRACIKVEGFDVSHAHVHVIPCQSAADFAATGDMGAQSDTTALTEMAKKLSF